MMCSEWEARLSEYVDGTLAADARALVETHLAGCTGCRAGVAELCALLAGAAALPRSIEPPRDFWAQIAARIGRRATWNVQRFWYAALAAAAAALVVGFALYRLRPPSTDAYARATDELTAALAAERDRLDPTTVVLLERNLGVIDRAFRESRDALARDPGNEALRGLVASAARERVELLRWATRVATSS
jgi:anti-sigma factor RsiW